MNISWSCSARDIMRMWSEEGNATVFCQGSSITWTMPSGMKYSFAGQDFILHFSSHKSKLFKFDFIEAYLQYKLTCYSANVIIVYGNSWCYLLIITKNSNDVR